MTSSLLSRRLTPVALVLSAASAVFAGVVARTGVVDPVTDPSVVMLAQLVPGPVLTLLAVLVGLLGTLTAAVMLVRRPRPRAVVAVGLTQAIALGLGLQGLGALSLTGYLVAFCLPAAVIALVVQVVRRYPVLRWPVLAAIGLVVGAGIVAGPLRPASLQHLLVDLGVGVVAAAPRLLHAALFMGAAIVWVVLVIAEVAPTPTAGRLTAAVTRHRRGLTVVAALGPLPYALVRMTWLTPWPLISPDPGQLTPETRLWGLLLGGGAALGVVLTLGLIRPWGERFPRWMPVVAGRPVPVAAAAVPGGVVAALVCAAAVPILVQLAILPGNDEIGRGLSLAERAATALVFPFWLWGPTLALAVWGYVGHRRQMQHSLADPAPYGAENGIDRYIRPR